MATPPLPSPQSKPKPKPLLSTTTTSSPLLTARPLNPKIPNPSSPHGILYRTGERAAASAVAFANTAATYNNRPAASAVVKLASPVRSIPSSGGPPANQPAGSTATVARPVIASQDSAPPAPAPLRGVPVATARNTTQPKVSSVPSNAAPTVDSNSSKDRDRNKDDIVIDDRKVSLSHCESGSLYALCRSWVHNGLRHETQPNYTNGEPLLPRPLPTSVVKSRPSETGDNKEEDEAFAEEERKSLSEDCSTRNLLEWHVKRAKRTRARLQKERLRRIERYKQRLALLIPPA